MTLSHSSITDGLNPDAQLCAVFGGYIVALHHWDDGEGVWDTTYHVFTDIESALKLMGAHMQDVEAQNHEETERRMREKPNSATGKSPR